MLFLYWAGHQLRCDLQQCQLCWVPRDVPTPSLGSHHDPSALHVAASSVPRLATAESRPARRPGNNAKDSINLLLVYSIAHMTYLLSLLALLLIGMFYIASAHAACKLALLLGES